VLRIRKDTRIITGADDDHRDGGMLTDGQVEQYERGVADVPGGR
jgi:hypothetical protein